MSVTLAPGARLGGYGILPPLRPGRLASPHLAALPGARGLGKPGPAKVIHAHLARDPSFVEMFLDEARLSARIADPNVVHVEDLGEADGMFYLAMEYVLGIPLSALLARVIQAGASIEPRIAVAIAMRVADGLHAAHELRDDRGAPLEVVHRDVSPQNILVSEAGHVKLIDFGVARARGRLQETEAGALKGKVRYMSPEQAWGRPIDRRTDVYALAIVLWEMLLLRRFIGGDNDIEALELARAPVFEAPSTLRSELGVDLDHVLMTALARDPEARYASAQAFRRALAGAVPEALKVEPGDLAVVIESYCGGQIASERKLLTDPGRSSAPPIVPADAEEPGPTRAHSSRSRRSLPDVRSQPAEASASVASAPAQPPAEVTSPAPASRSSTGPWIVGGLGLAVLGTAAAVGLVGVGAMLPGWMAPPPSSAPVLTPIAAASPPPAVDPCVGVTRLAARLNETVSTTLDTSAARPAFTLLGLRNPQAEGVPDAVVEIEVPGEGRTTIDLSTDTTATAENFDTVLAVFEGASRADIRHPPPRFSRPRDGRPLAPRRAPGAQGGSLLTVVVSGFGGGTFGMSDRGRVGLEVTARRATPPGISAVRGIVAGEQVVFEVEGHDEDRDADRARARFFDELGSPLTFVARGQRMALPEQSLLLPLQLDATVAGRARFLVRNGAVDQPARARLPEPVLVDDAGHATPPPPVELVHGREVGPDAPCADTDVCAAELTCGETARCEPLAERRSACAMRTVLELVPGAETSVERTLPAGDALFESSCAETRARGREDILAVTVPAGRWDLVLTTHPAEERAAPEDMVLSVRRDCLDARVASAPVGGCNDDSGEADPEPRLELRDVTPGEELFLFASATRPEPRFSTDGLAYVLSARLRAIRAAGQTCDPERLEDRCGDGVCEGSTRRCAPP